MVLEYVVFELLQSLVSMVKRGLCSQLPHHLLVCLQQDAKQMFQHSE